MKDEFIHIEKEECLLLNTAIKIKQLWQEGAARSRRIPVTNKSHFIAMLVFVFFPSFLTHKTLISLRASAKIHCFNPPPLSDTYVVHVSFKTPCSPEAFLKTV